LRNPKLGRGRRFHVRRLALWSGFPCIHTRAWLASTIGPFCWPWYCSPTRSQDASIRRTISVAQGRSRLPPAEAGSGRLQAAPKARNPILLQERSVDYPTFERTGLPPHNASIADEPEYRSRLPHPVSDSSRVRCGRPPRDKLDRLRRFPEPNVWSAV
jgi:hypothetical protein